MVNTRTDAELAAAVQAAVTAMLPQIREQVREEYRNGASGSGGNPPPVTIHTWLERFNKQKPRTFEKAVTPVDAENWISHMEKIFDVMGCDDVFKARLAVYKFEGDALAWWKAYKQAKGGDAWILTLSWAIQGFVLTPELSLELINIAAALQEEQPRLSLGLHKSHPRPYLCMEFSDVAQVCICCSQLCDPPRQGVNMTGLNDQTKRELPRRTRVLDSSGHADKKPDASGRVFALTQDQAANATDVPSIHDQTNSSNSQTVFPKNFQIKKGEGGGGKNFHPFAIEFNMSLFQEQSQSPRLLSAWLPIELKS
ncbi:hypothetical protein Tco_0529573 [Tanacetum coccineum]